MAFSAATKTAENNPIFVKEISSSVSNVKESSGLNALED
jgi:hypothetical protein